jgi:hypothetical protein
MLALAILKIRSNGEIQSRRQRFISLHAALTLDSELLPLSKNNGNNSEKNELPFK